MRAPGPRQPDQPHGGERQCQLQPERQPPYGHQLRQRHHQLGWLLHRPERTHPLRPAQRREQRTQPRHRPGPVANPRPVAIQRQGIPHQSQRRPVRPGRQGRRRRPGRLQPQYQQRRFSRGHTALHRLGRRGRGEKRRRYRHTQRRPGIAHRPRRGEQRRHHQPARRGDPGRRPQRRTGRQPQLLGARAGHRARGSGGQSGHHPGRERPHRRGRRCGPQQWHAQRQQRGGRGWAHLSQGHAERHAVRPVAGHGHGRQGRRSGRPG